MFLEIRGIRKSFGEGDSLVEVLKGIDLSVEKRRILRAAWTVRFRQIDAAQHHRRH